MILKLGRMRFSKARKFPIFFIISLLLCACSRSPDPSLYLLNSIRLNHKPTHAASFTSSSSYKQLRLGVERIAIPSYLTKSMAILLHETPYRLRSLDNHLWSDHLEKMISQVIVNDLQVLLPGAVIENYPWNPHLHPNYYLQVTLIEFKMMQDGKSVLRAHVLLYNNSQPIRALNASYENKTILTGPTKNPKALGIEMLVKAMNQHLTRLTQDISLMIKKIHYSETKPVEPLKHAFRQK